MFENILAKREKRLNKESSFSFVYGIMKLWKRNDLGSILRNKKAFPEGFLPKYCQKDELSKKQKFQKVYIIFQPSLCSRALGRGLCCTKNSFFADGSRFFSAEFWLDSILVEE
ncbi:MAG: hypothetical protein WCG84_03480 [Candidatus Moraniibacteriota bacterium]